MDGTASGHCEAWLRRAEGSEVLWDGWDRSGLLHVCSVVVVDGAVLQGFVALDQVVTYQRGTGPAVL